MKYRMYVDEVGNSDIEGSDNPNQRYLSLTGVICELPHVEASIYPEMEALKRKYFRSHPDDPVVFHRKEMLNGLSPFTELRDPAIREAFNSDLLAALERWNYTIITVCIDKKSHRDTYTVWRFDPYHYCLAILLERFVLFLKRLAQHGDVMAESRGGKEDMRLKKSFHGIWESGTDFIPADTIRSCITSGQLKVKPKSANVSGLQLADLLAHPSRSEILAEQHVLGRALPEFGQKIITILQNKYDTHQMRCFGKKFIQ